MAVKLQVKVETKNVSKGIAAKVARIAELNEMTALAEAEGKALKAEVIEAAGGAEKVCDTPTGIQIVHKGTVLATVKPQTRTTISAGSLTEAVAGLLAAFPEIADTLPEVAAALAALPEAAGNTVTFPRILTK